MGDIFEDEDTCDMMTNAPIPPYTQIFNTYGDFLSNAQLLVRYGFLLDGNERDFISWDLNQLSIYARSYNDAGCIKRSHDNTTGNGNTDATSIDKHGLETKTLIIRSSKIAGSAASNRATFHLHSLEDGPSSDKGADTGSEDQLLKINLGQILLEHVQVVAERWCCGGDTWAKSNFVYDPRDLEKEDNVNLPGVDTPSIVLDSSKNSIFLSEDHSNRSSIGFYPQDKQSEVSL